MGCHCYPTFAVLAKGGIIFLELLDGFYDILALLKGHFHMERLSLRLKFILHPGIKNQNNSFFGF